MKNFRSSSTAIFAVILTLVNLLPVKSSAQSPTPTIVVLPITTEIKNEKSTQDLVNLIKTKLKSSYHILPQDDVWEILTGNDVTNPTEIRQAMDLVQNSIESYYAYISSAKVTITAMNEATSFIQKNLPPSKKSSDLMITALMTQAWLLHNTGDGAGSTKILRKIFLTPQSRVQTDLYPTVFRSFVEKIRKSTPTKTTALIINSKPQGANVYVDHIFAGITPLTITPMQQNFVLGFDGNELKPLLKKMTLTESQKNLRVTLAKTKNNAWGNLNETKKTALAEKISTRAGADKVIFLEIQGQGATLTMLAQIYDAREKSLVDALSYDKPISNFSLLKSHVANYFASQLPAYLGSNQEFWETPKSAQKPKSVPAQKKNKSGILIGILAGVAAAGAVGVILATSSGGGSITTPTSTTGSVSVQF